MKIGIIDAEIIGKTKHRFPNLACMKISKYYKNLGEDVDLLFGNWEDIIYEMYDKIFISKVFTKTLVPEYILNFENIEYGGTGFYYDKAPRLKDEIEHMMPDYKLYDKWINYCIKNGAKESEFKYYKDYSIGFLTRGCFRQCQFCVNKNYKKCETHSNILEFYDSKRPKLCFLDDNFFANPNWKEIINSVKKLNKSFQFKQGLDERLLNDEKVHEIMTWKYDGDFIFAFDNIEDKNIIEEKLERIFTLYPNFKKRMKFYVFCGFDRNDRYDYDFWRQDLINIFERVFILAKYSAIPYIMRYEKSYQGTNPFSGLYSAIASWANQPSLFKKFDFKTYCICRGMSNEGYKTYKRNYLKYLADGGKKGSTWRYFESFKEKELNIVDMYFHIVPDSLLEYGNGKKFKEVKQSVK